MKKHLKQLLALITAGVLLLSLSIGSLAAEGRLLPPKKATPKTSAAQQDKAATNSSTQITLAVQPIGADDGQALDALLNKLNANVVATDKTTKQVIKGVCRWSSGGNIRIKERVTKATFTFQPTDKAYAPVKGTVQINAIINAEEAIIRYPDGNMLYAQEGQRLSSLTKQLKKLIAVEDSDGNAISYQIAWKQPSSVKFGASDRARSYTFTVKPISTRYLESEGTVSIAGADYQ